MMMKVAGAPMAISPMEYAGRRRPLPRWVWHAVAASAILHAGAGLWLYQQRFAIAEPEPTMDGAPPIVVTMPRPKPPEPQPQPDVRPPAPNTAIHQTPTPTRPVETLVVAPSEATDQPAGPIILTAPVDTPPTTNAVSSEPTPARDPVIRNPEWIRRPTGDQLMSAYPDRAIAAGVTGSATLSCGVRADGTMTGCSVVSETPGGYGFGRAAQSLSRYFRISPRTVDGQAVEGSRVTVNLRFTLPEER